MSRNLLITELTLSVQRHGQIMHPRSSALSPTRSQLEPTKCRKGRHSQEREENKTGQFGHELEEA